MGTHGYVVFKYKGIYYIYENRSDSYYEGLGKEVVDDINRMVYYKKTKKYKEQLLRVPFENRDRDGEQYFHSIYDSIYSYDTYDYYTSNEEPYNSYVYIIDFDEDEFIITKYGEQRYTFNLFDIPDNWIDIVKTNDVYVYENKEQVANERIKAKILELEAEITKLKSKLIDKTN